MPQLLKANIYESDDPSVRIHRRSHISSFALCPSKLAAEDKWETGGGGELAVARDRGRLFHRCAQYVLLSQKKGWRPERVNIEPVIEQAPATVDDDVKEEVREFVNKWIVCWPFKADKIREVEAMCASTILEPDESPDGLTHKIGGQIDLNLDPNHVWDWKTSWRCPGQTEFEQDIQVGSYALLASDRFGLDKVTVSMAFVRWGATRTVSLDLDAIAEWEQRLKSHLLNFLKWESEMSAADPETKVPGPHCAWCPILERCESAAPSVIVSIDDANDFGNHIERNELQTPAMKKSLIAWLEQHPGQTIQIGHRRYRLGLKGSHKVEDAQALAAICETEGIDFWGCLSVDKNKLATLCKRHPGLEAAIEPLVVDRRKPALVSVKE